MKKETEQSVFKNLPACAAEYIKLVIKKMKWRKSVRDDVQAELIGHFEDALRDCKNEDEKEKKAKELIENFGDAKLIADLARRAKKRCRPMWVKTIMRAFQAACIVIGLFVIYVLWFISGKPAITTNYIEVVNKMVRPTADDSQNAAPFYEKAANLIKSQNEQTNECVSRNLDEAKETDIVQIRQWLDKNHEALNFVEQGTEKSYYWQTFQSEPNGDNSMFSVFIPNLREYRTLAQSLRWRAYLSAEDGQYGKAFADLLTIYKFGKHQKGKSTLVQSLVGAAIEALSTNTVRTILYRHDIPAQQLESFYNNLQVIACNENFVVDPSFEKLTMYDEIQRCFTESHFGFEHIYLKRLFTFGDFLCPNDGYALSITMLDPPVAFNVLFTHPDKQQTRQMADAYYDFWGQIAAETPFELKERDLEKEATALIKGNILLEILAPAMQKVAILAWRNKTDIESTLAIIEIVRFKKEKGRLPDDLQELVSTGLLSFVPMDPYSDKPLVYKKTNDSFALYSFGTDFDDDGGKKPKELAGKNSIWPGDGQDGDAVFWPIK
jgi:hypothetical protein